MKYFDKAFALKLQDIVNNVFETLGRETSVTINVYNFPITPPDRYAIPQTLPDSTITLVIENAVFIENMYNIQLELYGEVFTGEFLLYVSFDKLREEMEAKLGTQLNNLTIKMFTKYDCDIDNIRYKIVKASILPGIQDVYYVVLFGLEMDRYL